jgi:hypothetical protein
MQLIMVNRSQNLSVYAPIHQIRGIQVSRCGYEEFGIKITLSNDEGMLIPVGSEIMAKELANEMPSYISGPLLDGAPCIYIDIDRFVDVRRHKLFDIEQIRCSCGADLKIDLRVNSNILPEKFILHCKECSSKYSVSTENMLAWCKDDS